MSIGPQSRALAVLPSEGQDHLEKAETLQKKGDVPGAIIELKNAVHADPELSQARYELGMLYLQDRRSRRGAQRELEAARARGVMTAAENYFRRCSRRRMSVNLVIKM